MDAGENAEGSRDAASDDDPQRKVEKASAYAKNRWSTRSMEKIEEKASTKRKRPKFVGARLPSPPPDPRAEIFAEEMVSYENTASKAAANALGVDYAFDNLDKLHSLMEEILEMRDRNAKLFRRVRDLERVRVTRKANLEAEKLIASGQDVVLPDEDVGFAESLLGAMLSSSFELSNSRNNVGRSAGSNRLPRSRSIGMEHRRVSCPVTIDSGQRNHYRTHLRASENKKKRPSLAIGTPKVSKWTRVKAAFKWEKAACTNNELPSETEANVRYLKIPENTAASSEVSGPPTPAGPLRPSSNQSTRITRRDENSDPSRRSRSLDGDASVPMNFVYSSRPRSKDNSAFRGKSVDPRIHKTPWGKVKDMMQLRRDSIGRLPARSMSRNGDGHSTSSLDSSEIHRSEQHADGRPPRIRVSGESIAVSSTNIAKSNSSNVANDFVDLASRRLTPTLTITVPSSEELRNLSSPESVTPSPPSPRQSFESGKSERFSQLGYETPKETRTGQVSPASSSSGILRYGLGRSKTCQGVPFAGDYKRQQSLKGESLGSSPKMQRRDSKWNKVKRAFLTSATSVPTSPNRVSSYFFDDGDATGGSYSASASAEDLENESASSPGVHAEIQRNYRLLHDKFGTEFYRKLAEWERLKSNNNSSVRDSPRSNARERDNENLRLLGEERLTPEFKKKLEEWKRMNKGGGENRGSSTSENRSVNRRRITDWQLWRSSSKPENKTEGPRLSDDFIKKMEEWKRIKSATSRRETEPAMRARGRKQRAVAEDDEEGDDDGEEDEEEDRENITDIGLSEKRRKAWKNLEDEEFKSLEKVLEALEMDRQTRLSKLQRIVGSQPQKTREVLIHTSTGLYRFEGISRKFTRKLYEWEKSQGISPELSTFRLLDPLRYGVGSPRTRTTAIYGTDDETPRRNQHRSKSVGCVDIDSWRTKRDMDKTTIRRLCSLSLNDIDNIDHRSCVIASSIPTIPDEEDTSEDIAMEDSEAEPEPEAVIVDVEDVIEETASPLRKYQPHQTPVYSVASSETTSIAVPLGTVTARHEPSPIILIEPGEIHPLRARACSINEVQTGLFYSDGNDEECVTIATTLPSSSIESQQPEQERSIVGGLTTERETYDFDKNDLSTEGNMKCDASQTVAAVDRPATDGEKEDSCGNWQMASPTNVNFEHRTFQQPSEILMNEEDESYEDAVITVGSNMRHAKKLLKTRRLTDTYVGYDWLMKNRPTTSNNVINNFKDEGDIDNDENSLSEINDEFEDNPNVERIIINEDTLNKIVVPTASSSSPLSATLKLDGDKTCDRDADNSSRKEKREATSVFVKTKRIVFSPFRREARNKTSGNSLESENSNDRKEGSSSERAYELSKSDKSKSIFPAIPASGESEERFSSPDTNFIVESKRPLVPKSPIPARKEYTVSSNREKSPSIRMMIRRYNDKAEIENCERRTASFSPIVTATGSATSSGSGSSTPGWRTPLAERRSIGRPDRYDEAKKMLKPRKVGNDSSARFCDTSASILSKSSSADYLRQRSNLDTRRERTMEPEFSSLSIDTGPRSLELQGNNLPSASSRAMKIRQAKEHFLSINKFENPPEREETKDPRDRPEEPTDTEEEKKKRENDKKTCSVERNDIAKSASVGMINVDEDTYERLQFAGENGAERGCDSLPRSNEHLPTTETKKSSTSKLSQIASKFKKARLRRAKDRENSGMSTVLKLCRQSLLVDIATNNSSCTNEGECSNSSMPTDATTRQKDEDAERKNGDKADLSKS
ncbi:uncharacterized protein [Venturia canescens]|uniref:uncharacterized protein isoform X2 n=1 Tax=Venturia canescens TaxID=32260 RepID=UPI001C9C1ED0|nr:uncharacterized protein LOC122419101 isoform X2 [Venturia canescens]